MRIFDDGDPAGSPASGLLCWTIALIASSDVSRFSLPIPGTHLFLVPLGAIPFVLAAIARRPRRKPCVPCCGGSGGVVALGSNADDRR